MNPAPFPHRMVPSGRQIRHDPLLGHAFVAGVHRRVPHERGAYFAATNAQGFREDHDLDPPPEGFHVVCYGDSYAAGDGVDNGERFSALLAAQLGVPVSNVAVPGHGPDQNVLQLERVPMPRADLILWCIAVQTIERIQSHERITIDREDRLWQVGRPHFVLAGDGSLELRGVPVAERGEALAEEPCAQIRSPIAAIGTELAVWLRARLVATVGRYLKSAPDPDYGDPASPGWRLLAALVRRFHSSAGDVPVAVVPLPTARYLTEDRDTCFQRRFGELERPAAGLHVLDVVTGMRRAPRDERTGFNYRLDGHYTVAGHAVIAAVLAEQLRLRGLVTDARLPRATVSAAVRVRRDDLTLHVGWELGDGYAQVRAGAGPVRPVDEGSADDRIVAEHRESTLTGHASRPGVLPLSAIHACLDDVHVAGPELRGVVLRAPCAASDLTGFDADDPRWFALVSGWVRWHGAAEVDLRTFLCYTGRVECETAGAEIANAGAPVPEPPPDDDELRWLRERIRRLRGHGDAATLRRRLLRLARRWELATRAARAAVLPTTAPLRRGRMALRLARAAPTGSGPRRAR